MNKFEAQEAALQAAREEQEAATLASYEAAELGMRATGLAVVIEMITKYPIASTAIVAGTTSYLSFR